MLMLNAVWCIMNLSYHDKDGVLSHIKRLIDVGTLSQLQNMIDDPCLDVSFKTITRTYYIK
jgi:hypothetical protein